MSPKSGRTGVVRRRRATFVTMVVAALVVPVAIAYACNPQAHVSVEQTGNTVTVYGSYFPGGATITISGNWGESVTQKASPGGGFQVSLTAPSAPGNYTVTASRPTGGFAPASFTVAAPTPAPAAARPSTPAASAPAAETARSAPGFKAPSVARSEAPASAERTNPPARSGGSTTSGGGGSSAGGTVTSASGQTVFSGSQSSATPAPTFSTPAAAASRTSTSTSRPAPARTTAPAEQAALSDLFSNYQPGRTPSLTGAAAGAPAGGAGSGLGLGIGLLAFGLLALVAGLTANEVRRRRTA